MVDMFYQFTMLSIALVVAFLQVEAVALVLNRENARVRRDSTISGKSLVELAGRPDKNSTLTSLLRSQRAHVEIGNVSHDLKVRATANSTVGIQSQSEPRIFFLFLTMSGIPRAELWREFFLNQPENRWRVFMHCKNSNICKKQILWDYNPADATQVDTVPSEYCEDLVSPMVQLLTSAIAESTSPLDKFVFVSDTTVPIKPFSHVYSALTYDQKSDFCLYAMDEWPRFTIEGNLHTLVVKHSQWMVLNQMHATALVQRWPSVKAGLKTDLLMVPWYREDIKGPSGAIHVHESSLNICKDEWAIFATIYGAFVNIFKMHIGEDSLPGLSGPPVQLAGSVPTSQGICRTFAFWETTEFGDSDLINAIKQNQSGTILSCYPRCMSTHPAVFEALSDYGALALRRSRYLFARKFTKYVPTLDQFRRIFLAEGYV